MSKSFSLSHWRGELGAGFEPRDELARVVARLTDPKTANETLHWGRNFLYAVSVETQKGTLEVVVKQFRNRGRWRRWKRRVRGSKAEKSWRLAHAVTAAGVLTPEPLMLIESRDPEGPSFFVSRRLEDFFEARYFFRALHAGRERELFPAVDRRSLLSELGRVARRLHDGGIWHRDYSIGNLLVKPGGGGASNRSLAVYVIDLNRAKSAQRLGLWRRSRELGRLPVLAGQDIDPYLAGYWGQGRVSGLRRGLFWFCVRSFLAKNRVKKALAGPRLRLKARLRPGPAHEHIPAAPAGAGARDRAVWDELSDQPHQHAGRLARAGVRLVDAADHARTLGAAMGVAPAVYRRYRRLKSELYSRPVEWGAIGLAVRPHDNPEELFRAIEDLGVRHLLIRLHPWQADHDAEEDLARELASRGLDLVFALPQNRELVKDRAHWRAAIGELGTRFLPYGRSFQIGQAINRSKWGVWNYREYLELVGEASEILRPGSGVEIVGPAVIDFEFHVLAGVLNLKAPGVFFDVVSSLLYVDRRGAPENRQLGFDTAHKATLLAALAATAKNAAQRVWITEVNWPLWEGPHAPAGKSVAVDEETQADYLTRYYIEVLATGQIERVYWWRLFAKGYGLIDPTDGRRRPSFFALGELVGRLGDSTCLQRLAWEPPGRGYRFRDRDGRDLVVGWVTGERSVERELPAPARRAFARSGKELAGPHGSHVALEPAPRYFYLD